jgi:hypothetical protein
MRPSVAWPTSAPLTRDVRDALRERAATRRCPRCGARGCWRWPTRWICSARAWTARCSTGPARPGPRPTSPSSIWRPSRARATTRSSIAYISLINTVNNIAERDQFLGRPIINVTDEGHIITKNPLLAPYVVKITKMWRKLGAWYWLATQNIDDLPKAAEPMLNMIEWWICLSMPPDEVEKIARFRELNAAQKALMLSARKEAGKFSEGVILSKSWKCCSARCRPACTWRWRRPSRKRRPSASS